MQAAIYGLAGTEISADEASFFRDAKPTGYILFKRNIETREQPLARSSAASGRAQAIHSRPGFDY